MTPQEIKQIFENFSKACKDAAKSLNDIAIQLNMQHKNRTNHKRKPSKY